MFRKFQAEVVPEECSSLAQNMNNVVICLPLFAYRTSQISVQPASGFTHGSYSDSLSLFIYVVIMHFYPKKGTPYTSSGASSKWYDWTLLAPTSVPPSYIDGTTGALVRQ